MVRSEATPDGPADSPAQNATGGRRLGRIRDHLEAFAPLAALAVILSGTGLVVGATLGVESLAPAETFFQIVLAGALMAVLRNEIGLRTYGLFAPVVIAFMMVGAGPLWGLVLFVNVLVVTLIGHAAVRPLKLGTAPRVAVLLSVAAIVTALAIAAAGAGQLPPIYGSGQVFFPTIISAWYADRAASEVEERGWRVPAKRLLGTLVAVALCYVVIGNEALVTWFISHPETWGVVLVTIAYFGSRPGFRVAEWSRFDSHYGGRFGPMSVAATHVRWRLHRAVASVASVAGFDVSKPEPRSDVLSMKRRNKYIETYNPPHLRPTADEKAAINERLTGLGIDSPETYAVIDEVGDLDAARRMIRTHEAMVVKPSNGYGGEGIIVVSGRDEDGYGTSKGTMTEREICAHVRRIVDGQYSGLEGEGTAIIEEKLTPANFMQRLHGDGVADVRVLVFQGYPVMAMSRLPTEASDGAANLHLGAVGVGLDIADGTPLNAYQQTEDRELEAHPDTGASLTDFQIPNWDGILETAVEAAAASGLGYTGVDVVLAEGNTPKILEVNVRPGLGIQNTTERGLFERLEFVEALPAEYEHRTADEKVSLAREWATAEFAEDALPDPDEAMPASERAGTEDQGTVCTTEQPNHDPDDPYGPTPVPATDNAAAGTECHDTTERADDGDGHADEDGNLLPGTVATRGAATGGILLTGMWLLGLPLLTVLFLLNAVGFVGGLCARALGIGANESQEPLPGISSLAWWR